MPSPQCCLNASTMHSLRCRSWLHQIVLPISWLLLGTDASIVSLILQTCLCISMLTSSVMQGFPVSQHREDRVGLVVAFWGPNGTDLTLLLIINKKYYAGVFQWISTGRIVLALCWHFGVWASTWVVPKSLKLTTRLMAVSLALC